MELDPFYYVVFMANAHNLSRFRLGRNFEAGGYSFGLDSQRVIASRFDGVGKTGENGLAIVINNGGLAVGRGVAGDDSTVDVANTLVPQANTQNWNPASEVLNNLVGDACVERSAWPW